MSTMKTTRDWLVWCVDRLGWPGMTGVVLLAGAVAGHLALVQPMQAQSAALHKQAMAMAQRQAEPQGAGRIRDWREDLPSNHQAYDRLKRLYEAAETSGLSLDDGSYRSQSDGGSGVTRLVISLPVSGPYPAIRAFLASALNQDTALALEGLRLSREDMGETELAADLTFALYLGERP